MNVVSLAKEQKRPALATGIRTSLLTKLRQMAPRAQKILKITLFIASLIPLITLGYGAYRNSLGANPIEYITHMTGVWCLRFLLITLSITPLRKFSGIHWLVRLRRMLGLYAFFYGLLHFLTYIWLDQFFDWAAIIKDIAKRPFITVGFSAFVLMIPLALTSHNAMIRLLGGQRWQLLHRCIYAIVILAVVHYWWLVKRDITHPLIYAGIVTLLLGIRTWWRQQKLKTTSNTPLKSVNASLR